MADLDEAARFLPYLESLGVSAVELLPVAEFAGDRSWGYNPALPYCVESAYGGPDALKAFVQAAHDLGIGVILDVVYNHLGPGDLDHSLWQFDSWNAETDTGGIYFYEDWRAPTPWGTRPDYGRPEVRQYLRDNALSWLQDYRLDGLRLDMTAFIRNADGDGDPGRDIADGWQLLQAINADVAASQSWKIVAAEDMQGDDWVTRPVAEGGAGFPSQWDPDFVRQLRQAVIVPDDASRDVSAVAESVTRQYSGRALARVVFSESHDADANGGARVPQEIDPADPGSYWAKKARLLPRARCSPSLASRCCSRARNSLRASGSPTTGRSTGPTVRPTRESCGCTPISSGCAAAPQGPQPGCAAAASRSTTSTPPTR